MPLVNFLISDRSSTREGRLRFSEERFLTLGIMFHHRWRTWTRKCRQRLISKRPMDAGRRSFGNRTTPWLTITTKSSVSQLSISLLHLILVNQLWSIKIWVRKRREMALQTFRKVSWVMMKCFCPVKECFACVLQALAWATTTLPKSRRLWTRVKPAVARRKRDRNHWQHRCNLRLLRRLTVSAPGNNRIWPFSTLHNQSYCFSSSPFKGSIRPQGQLFLNEHRWLCPMVTTFCFSNDRLQ